MILLTKQIIQHPGTASWYTAKETQGHTLYEVSISGGGNPPIIDIILGQGKLTKRLVVWELPGVRGGGHLVLEAYGEMGASSYDSVTVTFGTPYTKE